VTESFDIDAALVELRPHIEWPSAPDMASSVAVRLRAGARPSSAWARLVGSLRRPAFAPIAAVVIACLFLIASPSARNAVADFLGLRDIRITHEPPPEPVGGDLSLGDPVSLAEAQQLVDFQLLVPDELGAPDAVYFDEFVAEGMVSLVYGDADDIDVLVNQLAPRIDSGFFEKHLRFESATRVEVQGVEGYWIPGDHVLTYHSDGVDGVEESRLAQAALIWEKDGVVYRIESDLSMNEVIGIANSMEP
jgi:Domain of unknown function (DUF4367)